MTDPTPRPQSINVRDVLTPVLEAGPQEAAEAIVFLHGAPGSSRDWADLLQRCAPFTRAVALDLPGFGRAPIPASFECTVANYATWLGEALAALHVTRAHLVMHDFGGPIGLTWATMQPAALASVVLIDTGVLSGYRWHLMGRIWRRRRLGEWAQRLTTRPIFRLMMRRGNPRGLPAAFVNGLYDDYDAATRRAVLELHRTTDVELLAAAGAAIFPTINPPTLIIWGRADPYIGVQFAEQTRAAFPRAEVVILDRSGHWPFIDDPEGVARAVVPFLQAQLAGNSS